MDFLLIESFFLLKTYKFKINFMKNPFVRFIVATLVAGIVLVGLVFLFTFLGWNGQSRLIVVVNGIITITVWKMVYSFWAEDEPETDETNTENKK